MKRKSINSKSDFPTFRSSSATGFNVLRNNNRQFKADAVRNKRVKFTAPEIYTSSHNEPIASSERHEPARPRRSDAPKTSEYAFFKKLKKNAGCSGLSGVHEQDKQLKISEPSGSTRDFTTVFKDSYEKIKSSHLEKTTSLNSHNFFSPPQPNAPNNLEEARVVENSHHDIRSPLLAKGDNNSNENFLYSPLGDTPKQSGSEDLEGDIFSQKRKRLRQWVAETSVPDIENFCSKGYDLVSKLLSRLLPNGDQSKYCRVTEATPIKTGTQCPADEFLCEDTYGENSFRGRRGDFTEAEPLSSYLDDFCNKPREMNPLKLDSGLMYSPSSSHYLSDRNLLDDTYNTKYHRTKSRDCIEANPIWYLGDNLNKTREMIPLHLDTRFSNSPSASNAHFQYGYDKSESSCDERSTDIFSFRDPYFVSDLEAYGSSSPRHIKEQNEFLALDESNYGRGSGTLLLGWDFANPQDRDDVSPICDEEINFPSTVIVPFYDPHQDLGTSFEVHESHSLPFDSVCRSEFTLCPQTHLEKHSHWDTRLFEEDNLSVAKHKQYPLALSYVPKCLDQSEDHDTYTSCEVDDGLSLQHNSWVISKVFSEKHHSELEPLLSYERDLDTHWKCLSSMDVQSRQENIYSYLLKGEQGSSFYSSEDRPSISLYAEDTTDIHGCPSIDLYKPFGREIVLPFLLKSSSSWLSSELGNNHDDDCLI